MILLSAIALVCVQAQDDSKCPKAGKYSDGYGFSVWDHVYLRVGKSLVNKIVHSCQEWVADTPRTQLNMYGPDRILRMVGINCTSAPWTFTANIFEPTSDWRNTRPIKVVPVSIGEQGIDLQLISVLC